MNLEEPSRLADLVALEPRARRRGQAGAPRGARRAGRACAACSRELRRAHEALKIESEIREKVQSEMGKTQRDYMLRQQLEHDPPASSARAEDEESEVEQLRERIEAAGLPEEAQTQARARARAARADAGRGGRARA